MFRAHVLIVRRSKLYYTASGILTPIGGRPVHRLRVLCVGSAELRKKPQLMFCAYQPVFFFEGGFYGGP